MPKTFFCLEEIKYNLNHCLKLAPSFLKMYNNTMIRFNIAKIQHLIHLKIGHISMFCCFILNLLNLENLCLKYVCWKHDSEKRIFKFHIRANVKRT